MSIQGIDFTSFTLHVAPGILVCLLATVFVIKFMYRDISKLSFKDIDINDVVGE